VSAAAAETNRTEEGAGGVEHRHDYWQGREVAVLFDGSVGLSAIPLFPKGQGSTPAGVGYVKLPPGALVYEGAEKVTVLATADPIGGAVPPPGLTIQWRTAAASEWSEPVQLAYGTALDIPVSARETDMPHSTLSLWNFRLLSDRPPSFESVLLNVTATRGRSVVDWPGHPDFYASGPERVVFEGPVTTHQYGFPENAFYEGQDSWTAPTRLISHGTGVLDVYVNVTGFASTPPTTPAGYYLYVHNATQLGYVCCEYEGYDDVQGNNDLKTYHFRVPVEEGDMDGPYQPESRWGFRLVAGIGANLPAAGPVGFTDGASYDIDYEMKIVARQAEAQPS
ncbi:MAG TPA: hypothetical protein VHH36_00310, partial [Candidatus Thermoplasmatota archaeon]|nr:hypothetical protein [Candidatus Thermoplasmatota archaeon]